MNKYSSLVVSEEKINILNNSLGQKDMEFARLCATRDDLEYKSKINKTEQSEFISRSDAQIKSFSKTLKIRDKEICDLKRNVE